MPIYEYQCDQCGHRSEEMQRLSDPPLSVCPSCGGPYRKLISAPAFQFKGSGWYVTDYARNQEGKGKGKADEGGKSEGAAKSEGNGGKEASPADAGSKASGSESAGGEKASAAKGGAKADS